ncbi:hypothetical protein [Helicobacter cetorum]|uniref:hypothetical protein n=1 Tax=Helicobacter cetorum TaxID=138563 RepID=UPI000CF183C9|nr:hypothetical protein [Helicobacter cetorum]
MLKKLLLIIGSLLGVVILGALFVLFTESGNKIIASFLEKKVNQAEPTLKLDIEKLRLKLSSLDFEAQVNDGSKIKLKGDFSLFKPSLDFKYDVDIKNLHLLKAFVSYPLNGAIATQGTIKGDKKALVIKGTTNVAQSNTSYEALLNDFKPATIALNLQNARLEDLLYLVNQPLYAKGLLEINTNLDVRNLSDLKGQNVLAIEKGSLNVELINKLYKQNIKMPIDFSLESLAKLEGEHALINSNFKSNVININAQKTTFNLKKQELASDYQILIAHLDVLKNIVGANLKGALEIKGQFKGDFNEPNKPLQTDGTINLAHNLLDYEVILENNQVKKLDVSSKDMTLAKLLAVAKQPQYANAPISLEANLSNVAPLEGSLKLSMDKGQVNTMLVNKDFKLNLKGPVSFDFTNETDFKDNKALSDTKFTSTLANLEALKSVYDISSLQLNTPYTLEVPNLAKLQGIINQKLKGSLKLNGNVEQNPKLLKISGNSSLLDGKLDFVFLNNELKANLSHISLLKTLEMLAYPGFFNSSANASLNYNLNTEQGVLNANLIKGQFVKSHFSELINAFANFDITKEVYEDVKISSQINQKRLVSNVDMKSRLTNLSINKGLVDLNKNQMNMLVNAEILKLAFGILLKGDINHPKISLNLNEMARQKAKQAIQKGLKDIMKDDNVKKGLDNLLKDDKLKDKLQQGLKGLF